MADHLVGYTSIVKHPYLTKSLTLQLIANDVFSDTLSQNSFSLDSCTLLSQAFAQHSHHQVVLFCTS